MASIFLAYPADATGSQRVPMIRIRFHLFETVRLIYYLSKEKRSSGPISAELGVFVLAILKQS